MPPLGRKQHAILDALDGGVWVRGADLADRIGIPKHVLWPYIERLRWRGYEIAGCPKRGYRFLPFEARRAA